MNMTTRRAVNVLISFVFVMGLGSTDVGATEAKRKGWIGVGIGALTGGIIGGDLGGAAVGALAGGGIGYLTGNEDDKRRAEAQAAAEKEARAQAQITADPETAYKSPVTNEFVGTTWQVISYVSEEPNPEYASLVVTFPTGSKISTMALHKDGKAESFVEQYRIVEDVMVITGQDPDTGETYVNNFKYSVDGDQLIAVSPETRVVLQRVKG
jgi:hypothetical protein